MNRDVDEDGRSRARRDAGGTAPDAPESEQSDGSHPNGSHADTDHAQGGRSDDAERPVTQGDRIRSLTLTLRFARGAFHPVDALLAARTDVVRDALVYVDAFADGTGILLYRLYGESSALDADLADHDAVLAHEVVDGVEGGCYLYVYVGPGEPAGTLVTIASAHALLVDGPLTFTGMGLRVTLVGIHDELRVALDEVPESVDYTVERVGPFSDDTESVLTGLTERQFEAMRTAVAVGYYDVPKRAGRDDIASALDLSPSTIGKHLQKAERHVVTSLLDERS